MTDVKDTSAKSNELIEASENPDVPALDGSVDALVANLRAAKEQLAELLAGGNKITDDCDGKAPEVDRSAA